MPGLNLNLSGIGDAIAGVGKLATDIRSAITGDISPEAKAALEQAAQSADLAAQNAQAAVDQAEAASSNVFVAGWRPFIGWVCGSIFAFNYILLPIGNYFLILYAPASPKLPILDISAVMPVLLGMLGLGTLRTVEKTQGVAGRH